MACPYFYPLHRHAAKSQALVLPLPLGDAWTGICQASVGAPAEPEAAVLDSLCSLGYARGRCSRFLDSDPGPDAIRFTILRESETSLDLYYVLERAHHPFEHGSLSYQLAPKRLGEESAAGTLARQAEAYAESYLVRSAAAGQR
jgi:hypothetical protein